MAKNIFPYETHNGNFWPELAYRQSIEKPEPYFNYYIAYENNIPVGITGHYSNVIGTRILKNSRIWLGWFGVLSDQRRKGYGQKLLDESIKLVKSFGAKKLYLYTGEREEEKPARCLYLKNGFKIYRRGVIDKMPVVYMRASI